MRLGRCAWLISLCLPLAVRSAAPELEAIYPIGAARGASNAVSIPGKFDPWPPQLWMSRPGLAFLFETNKNKASVVVAPEAAPGPVLLRAYNEAGISEPRFFVIGGGPEAIDLEPNDHFRKPQVIPSLPVSISGRLDKSGDVDSFAVALKNGDWLDARVESHVLMSKCDAVLRLVTTNGFQLAWNHDDVTFDPRLLWRSTNDQTVVIQVFGFAYPANAEIRLAGGIESFYRLHLTLTNAPVEIPETPAIPPLNPPATAFGCIAQPREEDTFTFTAQKDQTLELRVEAAAIGSPLDAWLRIEDAGGKELASNDDAEGSRDPRLEWKAPASTNYTARIGSVTHRGGVEQRYQLQIRPLEPAFRAVLAASSITVTNGSTNLVKFNLQRLRGHTNELAARFDALPPGLTTVATNFAQANGDLSIPLIAETNALPFQGPIRLLLNDQPVNFPLTTRSENNGVPGGYTELLLDHLPHLWLTVLCPTNTTPEAPK